MFLLHFSTTPHLFLVNWILYIGVRRVQEQENQKRQLSEELEQLKAPQDNREASCQTPLPEEEVREEKGRRDHGAAIYRPILN